MPTDQELLELAAKAAGLTNLTYCPAWKCMAKYDEPGGFYEWESYWNPLVRDSDALRLLAQLKIDVWHSRWPSGKSYVASHKVWNVNDSMFYDDGVAHGDDAADATRRAIVRAAAEIGKGKQ